MRSGQASRLDARADISDPAVARPLSRDGSWLSSAACQVLQTPDGCHRPPRYGGSSVTVLYREPRWVGPFPCKRTAAKIVNWLQSSQIGVRPCAMLLTLARGRQQRLPTAQLVLAAAIALWTVLMIVLGQGDLAARGPVTRGTMETVVAFA